MTSPSPDTSIPIRSAARDAGQPALTGTRRKKNMPEHADMASEGWGEVSMAEGDPDEELILQGRADRHHLPWRLRIHRLVLQEAFPE